MLLGSFLFSTNVIAEDRDIIASFPIESFDNKSINFTLKSTRIDIAKKILLSVQSLREILPKPSIESSEKVMHERQELNKILDRNSNKYYLKLHSLMSNPNFIEDDLLINIVEIISYLDVIIHSGDIHDEMDNWNKLSICLKNDTIDLDIQALLRFKRISNISLATNTRISDLDSFYYRISNGITSNIISPYLLDPNKFM